MAFSPNGKWLALGTRGKNSMISVRDVKTGKEVCSLATKDQTRGLAFPKNDMLIHAGARIVRVFEFSVKKK
jgi:WD40 repeat protein